MQAFRPALPRPQDGKQVHDGHGARIQLRVKAQGGAVVKVRLDLRALTPAVVAAVELGAGDEQFLV